MQGKAALGGTQDNMLLMDEAFAMMVAIDLSVCLALSCNIIH